MSLSRSLGFLCLSVPLLAALLSSGPDPFQIQARAVASNLAAQGLPVGQGLPTPQIMPCDECLAAQSARAFFLQATNTIVVPSWFDIRFPASQALFRHEICHAILNQGGFPASLQEPYCLAEEKEKGGLGRPSVRVAQAVGLSQNP